MLHCDSVEDLSIPYHIGKKEWFPAESDPSVRIPWYLSRRVQRWKEDWTGRVYERQAQGTVELYGSFGYGSVLL